MYFRRYVLDIQFVLVAHYNHHSDTVSKLTNITRPVIVQKDCFGCFGYACNFRAGLSGGLLKEKFSKRRYVFCSVTQGRKKKAHTFDSKVQVLPEFFLLYKLCQILVACTIGLLWYNLSPLALEMLGKPQIIPYAQLLSLYLITERLQTPKALIEKELKFGRSNLSLFLGFFAGGVTSVILALLGFGAYSIIVGLIARSFVTTFSYWCFAPYPPHPTLKLVEVTQFLKFGLPLTLTGLLVFYYWNVDYFIVGKLLGDRELGYYFIAFKFPHYMIQLQIVVSTVVYPAFSKAADKNQLMRGFSLVTKYSAALVLLPCLLVLVQGEDIVRYVLGEKWLLSCLKIMILKKQI